MAYSESPFSSTSSSYTRRWNYDVFLSFRGQDTRKQFIDHLYHALIQAGIHTFRGDNELSRGQEISPQLLRAIEGSRISVVVFSRNYASSRWCLEELVKIIECMHKNHQVVVPIFYDTAPSDVRKQTGSYAKAFDKHEEHFKEEMEKVNRWREALAEAANLSGWDLNDTNGYEAELIKRVFNNIACILGNKTRIEMAPLKSGWTDFFKSGWTLLLINLILEMASAVFDQLGNALVGMVLAFVALLLSTAELIYMERISLLPIFHRPSTRTLAPGKPVGTIVEYFGLVGAVWQCVYSTVAYAYARQKRDNPIKMCLLPFFFLLCVVISKLMKGSKYRDMVDYFKSGWTLLMTNLILEITSTVDYFKSGWTLLMTSLILEMASAVFDQLGYAIVGMVLAFVALLLATAERVSLLPSYLRPSTTALAPGKTDGTIVEYFGLVGAVWQCFYSTVEYAYARQKRDNPIKMCLLPSIFLFCVVISKLIKKSHIE